MAAWQPTTIFFFPASLLMIEVLRTARHNPSSSRVIYQHDLNKAYCPLGQNSKPIRSFALQLMPHTHGHKCRYYVIQVVMTLITSKIGPECQSRMFRCDPFSLRSFQLRSSQLLGRSFERYTCLPSSSIAFEISNPSHGHG